jgi:hypothetical protein
LPHSTFPPLFWFIFHLQKDGALEDEKFTGYGSNPRPVDTWRDASRWRRGLFTGRWYIKIFMFGVFLAALACAGLGFWGTFVTLSHLQRALLTSAILLIFVGTGEAVKATFVHGQGSSFGCLANA